MNGPDNRPLVFVEWYKHDDGVWRPTSAMTDRSWYSFDWCEVHRELLFRDVGSGSSNAILLQCCKPKPIRNEVWSTLPFTDENGERLTRKQIRDRGYAVVKECQSNPFDHADEGRAEWCQVCESLYDEETTCRHIHDCYDGNGYCWGSGSNECDLEATRLSLYRILRLMPAEAVRCLERIISAPDFSGCRHFDSLLGGDCRLSFSTHKSSGAGKVVMDYQHLSLYLEPLGEEPKHEDRFGPGFKWLFSLDEKSTRQNRLTAGWIWQFEHSSRSIGSPETTLYHHCQRDMIEPLLECSMEHVPETCIVIAEEELERNAHTVRFQKDPQSTEYLVLVCEELDQRVEVSVADVARVDGSIWKFTAGRIVRNNIADIRTAFPNLIVQSFSKPKERRRARKIVKKS